MKAYGWAVIALGVGVGIASAAFAEDLFLSGGSDVAQNETPVLDPEPVTERPDSVIQVAETAEARSPLELPAVLQEASLEELTSSVNGKRVERKWRVIPFGRFRVSADDNIFISGVNPQSDVYFTLAPGIAAGWGDYSNEVRQLGQYEHYFEVPDLESDTNRQSFAFGRYIATGSLFLDHSEEDALDHDAAFAGRWESSKLTLGLRLYFKTLSGADIDIGDRVKRTLFGGSIASRYDLSDKTSLELNLYSNSLDYEVGADSRDSLLEAWFNYQLRPKTQASVGMRFGTTDFVSGSLQWYEQIAARMTFLASGKLAFTADGGIEWRQFGEGGDDLFTVFNVAANYRPFDGTGISLNAFRRNSASGLSSDQTILATGVAARIRQRFFHRFYVTFESGYQNSQYRSDVTGADTGRTDDTVYVKPTVSFDVTKYLSAESSYQYQRNDSTFSNFAENTITFQINLQF